MAFTPAQVDAMTATGRTLLVSAAAGSGKTFTLTHRIIDSIIADESKSIDRLLIVTFTRAAAGELKAKISKALTEAIEKDPENLRLRQQLLKLGSAHISTIDSFFSEPVRANFEKLGLPASMRMADEAELSSVRDGVMKNVLEDFFNDRSGISEGSLAEVGHRSGYTDLLSLITAARDTSNLIPTLTEMHKKLITSPAGVGQLRAHSRRMLSSSETDFFESAEGKVIRDAAASAVEYAVLRLEQISGKIRAIIKTEADSLAAAGLKKYVLDLEDDKEKCLSLAREIEKGYRNGREAALSLKFKTISRLSSDEKSEVSESFKELRTKILDPIKKLRERYFFTDPEELSEQFKLAAELCGVLADLLSEFDRRYSEEKLKKGVCEFSDMPKFMLRLLQNEDGTPTALADAMAKNYDEVYIDEYQDVNEIQDRIFELIGRDRRFMVGDIKQSIYGFREAEPSIFADYRRRFPLYDRDHPEIRSADGGNSIFMSNNFRCDENIIKFSNTICSTVFSAFAESIGYTERDDLIFTKDNGIAGYVSPVVTVNLIQPPGEDEEDSGESIASEDKLYDEAVVTANEIARLIREERTAKGERIRAGDIAVLVRSHGTAKPLTDALTRLGIKYVSAAKSELFESKEMKLLSDLLTVVDNPRSDVPLSNLLTAEAEGMEAVMSFDDVITVRKHADGSSSLFDALIQYGESGEDPTLSRVCLDFVSQTEKMRRLSAKLSVDKFLKAVSQTERYAPLCESEAFTYLYNCSCKYVRNAWNGLYSFLSYFKNLLEKGESGSEPMKAQPDEVRIMTVHQSKGLEFNVCFLFGLGKQFNLMDTREPLIFSRHFGLSMKLPPSAHGETDPFEKVRRRKEDTLLMKAAGQKIKTDLVEEEARIFYVALTRACERLYLSGTLKKRYDELEAELLDCPDVSHAVKTAKSYVQWVLLSLSRMGRQTDVYKINTFDSGKTALVPPIGRHDIETQTLAFTEDDKTLAAEMNRPHGESEEEKRLSLIPAKVAASKVSPSMLDNSVFIPVPAGNLFSDDDRNDPDGEGPLSDSEKSIKNRILLMRSQKADFESLLEENKKPTAAEKGTAAHLFLQYCDYGYAAKNGIESEISRLREQRFISERTASIIDRKQLSGFFRSELFEEIVKARQVRREFRFGMFKSASEFTENEELKSLVAEKKIFVQGSVDLLIEAENGEILLCDYKTDRITVEERADRSLLIADMRARHGEQLRQYCFAVKRIFGRAPSRIYIYSVPIGEALEIGLDMEM